MKLKINHKSQVFPTPWSNPSEKWLSSHHFPNRQTITQHEESLVPSFSITFYIIFLYAQLKTSHSMSRRQDNKENWLFSTTHFLKPDFSFYLVYPILLQDFNPNNWITMHCLADFKQFRLKLTCKYWANWLENSAFQILFFFFFFFFTFHLVISVSQVLQITY